MTRHDYDLPADYEQRAEDGDMVDWYTAERCRRQALRQDTRWSDEATSLRDRVERIVEAAAETVPVER